VWREGSVAKEPVSRLHIDEAVPCRWGQPASFLKRQALQIQVLCAVQPQQMDIAWDFCALWRHPGCPWPCIHVTTACREIPWLIDQLHRILDEHRQLADCADVAFLECAVLPARLRHDELRGVQQRRLSSARENPTDRTARRVPGIGTSCPCHL
jgi:hypothetical protein